MSTGDPLPPLPPTPLPGRYRHYKGGRYEVLGLARHSEDLAVLVLYRPLDAAGEPLGDGTYWVRPHAMWAELVEHGGRRVARFTPE
jgi:hypothetical protein